MSVKERILTAGVSLLHDEGFAALTQPRIAKAAGVRQSHLTYYFPTRADLLFALAEHSVDQALNSAVRLPGTPHESLLAGIRYLPRARMLIGLITAADNDAAIRPALEKLVAHVRGSLAATLKALGYTPSPAQINALHGLMIGLAVLNLGQQSEGALADIDAAIPFLLKSIPRQSASPPEVAP